jgi:ATP-dependent helicase HepA
VVPRSAERVPQHLPDRQRLAASVRPAPAAAAEEADDGEWQALIDEARTERERLEQELHTGRDRLLELNSGGAGEGDALVEAILEQDDQFALPIYMETLFDAFGIDSEDHSENALILKPSEKMLDASFPLGDDEGVTITYDRNQALSREDMQFITWEHPMVQGGMDLVLSGSMGNTAVALIKNKALKPGTVLLELLYVSEVVAPRSLQLGRYLPPAACAACSTPTATTCRRGSRSKPSTINWKAYRAPAPTSSSRPSAIS